MENVYAILLVPGEVGIKYQVLMALDMKQHSLWVIKKKKEQELLSILVAVFKMKHIGI